MKLSAAFESHYALNDVLGNSVALQLLFIVPYKQQGAHYARLHCSGYHLQKNLITFECNVLSFPPFIWYKIETYVVAAINSRPDKLMQIQTCSRFVT